MLFARAASRLGAAVLRPRAAVAPPLLRAPALAAPPLTMGPIVHMSLWKSPTVQEWVEAQAKERPDDFLPRPWTTPGYKRTGMCGPRLSRRRQSLMVKQAIKAGEIKLEPTRMPDSDQPFDTRNGVSGPGPGIVGEWCERTQQGPGD